MAKDNARDLSARNSIAKDSSKYGPRHNPRVQEKSPSFIFFEGGFNAERSSARTIPLHVDRSVCERRYCHHPWPACLCSEDQLPRSFARVWNRSRRASKGCNNHISFFFTKCANLSSGAFVLCCC